jgi:nitrogen-specific signal transduction histidine kinase
VRILANPIVLRGAVVLFCGSLAFVVGLVLMRLLRRSIQEESAISLDATPSLETLPLHVYNTVIQQLKQQKHELEIQTQTEQRRARTTETFSQAVLTNLSSGVLVFGINGLVKQSNPAARQILGFASPSGMSAEDIFRDAKVSSSSQNDGTVVDEVHAVLHEGSKRREVAATYMTPTGIERHLSVTASPIPSVDGSLLGTSCTVTDLSHFEQIRRYEELHGEISAEKALDLRTSLTTISGYAQQLAGNHDPELAQQLAADIAAEAARLDRTIGGFLTEKRTSMHKQVLQLADKK